MQDINWLLIVLAAIATGIAIYNNASKVYREHKKRKQQEEYANWVKKQKEQGSPPYKSNLNKLLNCPKSCFEDLSYNRAVITSSRFNMGDSVPRTRTFRDLMIHDIDIYADMALLRCEDVASQCRGAGQCNGAACSMDKRDLVNENLAIFYDTLHKFNTYENATPGEYGDVEKAMISYARELFDKVNAGIAKGALDVVQGPLQNPHRRFCAMEYTINILNYIGLNLITQVNTAHQAMQKSNGMLTRNLFSLKVYPKPNWLDRYEREKRIYRGH